ncbi:MAG: hypothetical protein M3Q92_06725 [Actinomycetota bacterium]|nr:hypothetical protein [Actinomycetota bacterium]
MTRRAVTALVLCALVGAGAAGGAHTGGTPVAFVAIPAASELAVVLLGTGRVLARVRVPRGPQELAAYHEPGGRNFVLVTSPAAGAVTMIDARTRRIVKVWRGFGRPSGIVVDALRAYVTDTSRGQLVVLDLRSRRIVARIDVGGRPHALAVGDLAVIADERRPSLALVAVRHRRVLARMQVGGVVRSVSERPDTADVLVSYGDSGSIARIDWGRRRVAFRRDVAGRTGDILVNFYTGDRVWVADEVEGRVRVAALRDGRILQSAEGCPGARALATVHRWRVVATCTRSASLIDWDTSTGQLRRTRLGGSPAGVAFTLLP